MESKVEEFGIVFPDKILEYETIIKTILTISKVQVAPASMDMKNATTANRPMNLYIDNNVKKYDIKYPWY